MSTNQPWYLHLVELRIEHLPEYIIRIRSHSVQSAVELQSWASLHEPLPRAADPSKGLWKGEKLGERNLCKTQTSHSATASGFIQGIHSTSILLNVDVELSTSLLFLILCIIAGLPTFHVPSLESCLPYWIDHMNAAVLKTCMGRTHHFKNSHRIVRNKSWRDCFKC